MIFAFLSDHKFSDVRYFSPTPSLARDGTAMLRRTRALVLIACMPWLDGCATANLGDATATASPQTAERSGMVSKAGYVLSADEQELGCKKLTGRMQLRILEIRDYNERNRTTLVSRALQSGSTAVLGGPKAGLDPEGTYAKDRATLEAYNQALAAKGCKTYDLESELQPQDFRATPTPTIKPASGAAQ